MIYLRETITNENKEIISGIVEVNDDCMFRQIGSNGIWESLYKIIKTHREKENKDKNYNYNIIRTFDVLTKEEAFLEMI